MWSTKFNLGGFFFPKSIIFYQSGYSVMSVVCFYYLHCWCMFYCMYIREEDRTERESKLSLLWIHTCYFLARVTSLLIFPWYIHAHMKRVYVFVYGNLIAMQANRTGACGARGGKFWLVKVSSSSDVLSLLQDDLYAQGGGKERQEERCQSRS